MDDYTLFKSTIINIKKDLRTTREEEIIFRIININNIYFFAQEISTGSIFPTYNFKTFKNANYSENINFNTYSYLEGGRYFVFLPLTEDTKIFNYKIEENQEIKTPSIKEVNTYLKQKGKDKRWQEEIKRKEKQNVYYCDLETLKQIVVKARANNNYLNIIDEDITVTYEQYIPSIDIEEISEFGYDLSSGNKLCNLVGRNEEKKRITKIVAIQGSSILLVGPSGTGKTAIVEGLAADIRNDQNTWFKNKIIFSVNPASLISDTKYSGEFEKKIQRLIDFCVEHKGKIILFIDEIHTLYGLGRTENSAIDAMNILKPYLDRGDITVIGTTTNEEYTKYMKNDLAFIRRIEELPLKAPDKQLNIKILLSYVEELEHKYNVKFVFSEIDKIKIINHIVEITEPKNQKVIGTAKIENPTISKKLLEEAFTEAVYNRKDIISIEEIIYAILTCGKLSPAFKEMSINALKEQLNYQESPKKPLMLVKKV